MPTTLPPWDDTPKLSWNDLSTKLPSLYKLRERSTRTKDSIVTTEKSLNDSTLSYDQIQDTPIYMDRSVVPNDVPVILMQAPSPEMSDNIDLGMVRYDDTDSEQGIVRFFSDEMKVQSEPTSAVTPPPVATTLKPTTTTTLKPTTTTTLKPASSKIAAPHEPTVAEVNAAKARTTPKPFTTQVTAPHKASSK